MIKSYQGVEPHHCADRKVDPVTITDSKLKSQNCIKIPQLIPRDNLLPRLLNQVGSGIVLMTPSQKGSSVRFPRRLPVGALGQVPPPHHP